MNEDTTKGNWKEFKGKIKEKWGQLTDDQIKEVEGDREQIVGAIQKSYGKSKEEAKSEYDNWKQANGYE